HGSSLQIVRCSFFHWNARGACLAHHARGRRIFGTARGLRRRRTASEERETRDSSDQANGYLRVFKLHKRRARVQTVGDDSEEVSARSKFSHKTLGLWFGRT